ncbi:MAG: hypothetical protein L0Z50_06540 [Verrucomicrobiales bacterium]|nr:hypothetical protein [Verrucomicrobiales bacterium]
MNSPCLAVGLVSSLAMLPFFAPVSNASSLEFAQDTYEMNELDRRVPITLLQVGTANDEMRYRVRAIGGTADPSRDFDYSISCAYASDAECSLSPSSISSFEVWPKDDGIPEGDETLVVELHVVSGGTVGARNRATILIHDGAPTIYAVSGGVGRENTGSVKLLIERRGSRNQPATVDYHTLTDGTATAGLDFNPQAGTIRFEPNERWKEVEVPVLNDGLVEAHETVRFELSNPSQGTALGQTIGDSAIVDDEASANLDLNFRPAYGAYGAYGGGNVEVQPDGKILVGGPHWIDRMGSRESGLSALVRLNPDGSLDTSFRVSSNEDASNFRIALDEHGKMLISGFLDQIDGVPRRWLARLLPNGRLDPAFVPAAEALVGLDAPPAIAALHAGRYLLWGDPIGLVGLRIDGSMDEEFNRNIALQADLFRRSLRQVAEQADGRLLCVGEEIVEDKVKSALIRLNADGTRDAAFGPITGVSAVLPLADGRTVISSAVGLVRLTSLGVVDSTFVQDPKIAAVPLAEVNGKLYGAVVLWNEGLRL